MIPGDDSKKVLIEAFAKARMEPYYRPCAEKHEDDLVFDDLERLGGEYWRARCTKCGCVCLMHKKEWLQRQTDLELEKP